MAIRQVVGVVGAVIGGYYGGVQGAQAGWAIGNLIGGVVDPLVLDGPKIGEISQQTSQEGVPRPIIFALSPPIAGNIIVAGKIVKISKKVDQGKGGPKVKTTNIYRTYAIGVCEGPITRFVRVWRNGELVYDDRTDEEVNYHDGNPRTFADIFKAAARRITNNETFLERVNFHLGSYSQDADPDLETFFGVGTTPAHRGTAYMTVRQDDLTDLRGAIPQFLFQVERCEGAYLTSRPYSIECVEGINSSGTLPREAPLVLYREALDSRGSLRSGELVTELVSYDDAVPEAMESSGELIEGDLRNILRAYEDALPEAIDSSGALISGDLDKILIIYDDAKPEALNSSGSLESGSLS